MLAALAPLARAPAAEREVRIGVQKYGTLVILRAQGGLDAMLGKLGYRVSWTEFPGGPQLLEALNVGELDFGTAGEAPPIFAQAAGAPLVYVGYEPPAPKGEAILVPDASPIHTLSDLRGKRVALNKGSNVHFLLVQALRSVELTPADIEPVYLTPADARAAFERGAVDAWVIWDPFLAAAQAAVPCRVLTDGTGLAPNRQFFLATRDLAGAHRNVVEEILQAIAAADVWALTHQADVAAMLAPAMGLKPEVLAMALGRMTNGVQKMTADVVADQQKMADTFQSLRLIPRAIAVRENVWPPA